MRNLLNNLPAGVSLQIPALQPYPGVGEALIIGEPIIRVGWGAESPRLIQSLQARAEVELYRRLIRAEALLMLPDDFDGSGRGAPLAETLERAKGVALSQFRQGGHLGWQRAVPRLSVGAHRSIELNWKGDDWRALVNIPRGDDALRFAVLGRNGFAVHGTTPDESQLRVLLLVT